MIEQACNNFVLVIRDETETAIGGMLLPTQAREKPHSGTIHAIGDLVQSKNVQEAKGKKCLFHPTTGWEIEYEGVNYVVLDGHQIIALP